MPASHGFTGVVPLLINSCSWLSCAVVIPLCREGDMKKVGGDNKQSVFPYAEP